MSRSKLGRRDFLQMSALAAGVASRGFAREPSHQRDSGNASRQTESSARTDYKDSDLSRIAFPLGGIGAGMICLEGTGALTHFSLHNRPDLNNEPLILGAVSVKGQHEGFARVLEGPVPDWKLFPGGQGVTGLSPYGGLPRFTRASFKSRFPFATVSLADEHIPLSVEVMGWSPFEPGDADSASLPVAGLEYTFANPLPEGLEAVFSFNVGNFLDSLDRGGFFVNATSQSKIESLPGGFLLRRLSSDPAQQNEASFAAWTDEPAACVNLAWYRGGWFDSFSMLWRDIQQGACYQRPDSNSAHTPRGATLFVPFKLGARQAKTIKVGLAWYSPHSDLRTPGGNNQELVKDGPTYRPWYSGKFPDIHSLVAHWRDSYSPLKQGTKRFTDCL